MANTAVKREKKIKKDPLEDFSQSWLLEPLMEHETFTYKKMFGGLAVYFAGRMVAHLAEEETGDSWQGVKYDFPIWNGLLIPTDYQYQESLQNELSALIQHPVLKKWLYLPLNSENYESQAEEIISLIRKKDPRVGVIPGHRATRKSVSKKKVKRSKVKTKSHSKA